MAFLYVYSNDEFKYTVALKPDTTTIGRTADNDIVIDNAGVSARHAVIVHDADTDIYYLEDANSTNGVFVNGRRITRHRLRFDEEITILKHKLKFKRVDFSDKFAEPKQAPSIAAISQSQTVAISTAQIQALIKERQGRNPYLLYTSGSNRGKKIMLSDRPIKIGKAANCEIRIRGWFAPKLAASIVRESNGCYLMPEKGVKIRVNNAKINAEYALQNHDRIDVHGVNLTFYNPPREHGAVAHH
ncbi:MAG: FHA domain-containing protein [Gammaproteobacteria bacterium]